MRPHLAEGVKLIFKHVRKTAACSQVFDPRVEILQYLIEGVGTLSDRAFFGRRCKGMVVLAEMKHCRGCSDPHCLG